VNCRQEFVSFEIEYIQFDYGSLFSFVGFVQPVDYQNPLFTVVLLRTKPDYCPEAACQTLSHQLHLARALIDVGLIDADAVDPNCPRLALLAYCSKYFIDVGGDFLTVAIAMYDGFLHCIAPMVGYGLIPWLSERLASLTVHSMDAEQ